MKNHVNDLILVADVPSRRWHELVDNFAEKADIASSVVSNAKHKVGCSLLVLLKSLSCCFEE
jgi:hypothetical protein